MKFAAITKNIRAQLLSELKEKERSVGGAGSVSFGISDRPKITEKHNKDWVEYGEDNLYPLQLGDLVYGSAIHNSIIKTKAKMTAGDGLLVNGAITAEDSEATLVKLPTEVQGAYKEFLKNPHDKDSVQEIIKKISYDLQLYGAFAYEVVWNKDFTRIARVKYVKVANLRAGKMENDKVKSYWYSPNWKELKNNKPVEIRAFDKDNKTDLNQIVYKKIGGLDYYGEPSYIGAITWIQTDFQMGIFHLSNLENGMNPSMKLQFYKVPTSEREKQDTLDDIRRAFTGAKKTGKHMVFFSDGKDTAPEISPIPASDLPDQLLLLAELCDKKILTGHQLTSPLLVGIATSGQLGGNTEIEKAFKIFDNVVIDYDRDVITDSIQPLLDINRIPIKIKINPFNPFRERAVVKSKNNIADAINSLSPLVANKVLESMTVDEVRQLVGLTAATGEVGTPKNNEAPQA